MKKPVKCYIWSTGLYDTETLTLQKVDQKYLELFKCDAGGRRISIGLIM
jgi:hypothetical protein